MTPKQFLQAIKPVAAWASKKSTLQILECLRFRDGRVLATDTHGQATYPIEGVKELDCCVNAAAIMRALSAMPSDEELKIKAGPNEIVLRAGRARHRLSTLPAQDMPTLDIPESDDGAIIIPRLSEMFNRLQPFMAVNDVRHYLNGICLHDSDGRLRAAATDGHRIAVQDMGSNQGLAKAIVPAFAVRRLTSLSNPKVVVQQEAKTMHVFDGSMTYSFKLIDGIYPDIDRVIPRPSGSPVKVKKAEFSAALASAAVSSNDENKGGVNIMLFNESAVLKCDSKSGISSEGGFDFDYPGPHPEIRVSMNVEYIRDVVSATLADTVEWFPNQTNGNLFRDPLDEGFTAVIAPMRI